jgi:hypothetical protein
MGNELLRPIDADTAHAVEEIAKTTGKAVDAVAGTGKYVSDALGTVPADVIGVLGGDWLRHARIRNWAKQAAKTREHLEKWGAKEPFEDPTPAIAIPIIEAAIDEDREVLQDLWARLLASAMHPDRKKRVRQSFIEILKQLDPLDAACLRAIGEKKDGGPTPHDVLVTRFKASSDEIEVSLYRLNELRLIHMVTHPALEALGKLFLAAVED